MFEAIRGKRVLVTGASSGIGACMAELFASEGAIVGIHFHTGEKNARAIRDRIQKGGGQAFILEADLLDRTAREALVTQFAEKAGGIEVLVNNAGGPLGAAPLLTMDTDSWEMTIALNLTAPYHLAREAFRHMKDHGGGRIINISSISARYGGSEQTIHYGAAKAGLEAVTKTLARAGARYNILVNAIRPGVIDTPAHRKMGRETLEERVRLIPLGRAGTPLDVARLCLFLASEGGDFITGQVYGVTGGD